MNPNTTNDDDDMPAEIDFAGGKRGKFYQAVAQLNLPVYLVGGATYSAPSTSTAR